MQQTSRVFHVQYIKPVVVTDVWRSEAMGVSQPMNEMPKLSKIEREETKLFEQECRLNGKRWESAYPWKVNP